MDVVAEIAQAQDQEELGQVIERWKRLQGQQTQQILLDIKEHTAAILESTYHLHSIGFKAESLEYLRSMLSTIDEMVDETVEHLANQKSRAQLIAQKVYLDAKDLSSVGDKRYIQAAAQAIQEDDELIQQASEHLKETMNG